MEKQILYDPSISWNREDPIFAPRPSNIEGLKIGLVDNAKHNAGPLLKEIGKEMIRSFGAESFEHYQKQSPSQPAHHDLLDTLAKECDLAICGVGD